jgi:FkbM family methyltransferase
MNINNKYVALKNRLLFDNRWQLLLARVFSQRTRFVSYRYRNVQCVADHSGGDESGLWPCLVGGMYDTFLDRVRKSVGQQPINILDLGANAGGFSLAAAERLELEKIVAVEMNPLTYSRMRLNLLTNYGPKVHAINAAVGPQSAMIKVPWTSGSTGEAVPTEDPTGSAFAVPMMTFDEIVRSNFAGERIHVVKVDIEGSEWGVFASDSCQTLSQCDFLIMEVHPQAGRRPEELSRRLLDEGLVPSGITNSKAKDVVMYFRS